MTPTPKQGLARMVAARQQMLTARTARSEALQRFRSFAAARLNDFMAAVDPITGSRMVELIAEGSKVSGDLSVTVAFFDGTKLRIAVDPFARMTVEATPPEILHEVGTALDIAVAPDLSRAQLAYEPAVGPGGSRCVLDLDEVILRLVDSSAQAVEEESAAITVPAPPPGALAQASATKPASAKPALSYSLG